jgi:hypothetical protein
MNAPKSDVRLRNFEILTQWNSRGLQVECFGFKKIDLKKNANLPLSKV